MRTISIYLRVTEHTTTEVTAQNRPKSQRSYIIRNQPVTLRIGIFRHEAAVAIMSKAELEAEGWKTWLLNISKNHSMMFPVYIQPDYDYENPPITVSNEGVISVVLNTTDTEESAAAIKGMPGDMWEAELTGFAEDDTTLETPIAILQWPIGYINRVADENADAPGLLESTYYTKEQVNELLRQIAPEGTWGHIIGDITDQEDLIALLEEKANKATTLGGYGITDAYTKTEIDAKVASVFHYKDSVNSYSDLPVSGMEIGDVYNVVNADEEHGIKAGDNVAWNGEKWDVLAGEIDLSGYIQKAEKGEPNGVPTLDENGKVPMSQMPVLQLDSPPTTSTAGSVGQLATWHDSVTDTDHLYHLVYITTSENATLYHWDECVLESQRNVAGGFAGLDGSGKVLVNNLPIGTNSTNGIVRANSGYGTAIASGGAAGLLTTSKASASNIDAKSNQYQPIVPSNLDYAVRSVLPNITEIPAATSDYSLVDSSATTNNHSHVYSHTPTSAPTYRLPQVTNTAIAHYIELTVDFTAVQTYSFLDNAGEPIVPLFTPAIAAGDVYTFKMEYSAIKAKWLIYPQKQGAVADDFVMRGEVGAANGVAGLDANAKVPRSQLPTIGNSASSKGVAYTQSGQGVVNYNGMLYLESPTATGIANRTTRGSGKGFGAIAPDTLNLAVTAALTDSNKISLTDAQKAAAQEVFGVGGDLTGTGAPTTSTVGKVMDRYLDTATGKTYTCVSIGGTEQEPRYNWKEGVYVDNIPLASYSRIGGVMVRSDGSYGLIMSGNYIATSYASNSVIDAKQSAFYIISPYNLNYAVRSVLPNVTEIPAATSDYSLVDSSATTNNHSMTYRHSPQTPSVYHLPAVSASSTILHEIVLSIKFSSTVLTYEFQDSAGTTLVPLPLNGDIEAGSVITFLCRYNPLLSQWVIMPVMDGKEAQE